MFRSCNTKIRILNILQKILVLGLVQNKGKKTRRVPLIKETKKIFWMQDLMELKSMHPSSPVFTCNLPFLECFEDSALYLEVLVRYELVLVFQVCYWSVPPIFFLYPKQIADKFPFQVFLGLYNGSLVQHLVTPSVLEYFLPNVIQESLGCFLLRNFLKWCCIIFH